MTIVPRTGPLSAISARATTSWYHRGKSSDRDTIAPLVMAAQRTGVPGGPSTTRATAVPPGPSVGLVHPSGDGLDPGRGVVGVLSRQIQEGSPVGLRLGFGSGIRGGDPGLGPFGHQAFGLFDQSLDH